MQNPGFKLITILMLITAMNSCQNSTLPTVRGLLYSDGKPVGIEIKDGRIAGIIPLPSGEPAPETYIAPGLIDIQINGYLGVNFSGDNLTADGIRKATETLWKEGVTSYFPTVITSPHERIKSNFAVLAEAMKEPETGRSIAGFHLEGPYISPEKGFRGAHHEQYVRPPDWDEFLQYQEAAAGAIKLVTVAPGTEGFLPFIKNASGQDVVVSLGHHDGTADEIRQSADAGAVLSTHLGNGCANMINRHHNPIWPQLAEDRLSISIIVDGHHLTREEVRSFYKVKGPDKTILVSDAVDLAGLEPGEYTWGDRVRVLTPEVVKLPAEDVLAGAALPLRACIGNMMDYTGCSLEEAIRMASTNPARLFRLEGLGEIKPGNRADLILFTLEDGEMKIHKTLVAGEVVYSADAF